MVIELSLSMDFLLNEVKRNRNGIVPLLVEINTRINLISRS